MNSHVLEGKKLWLLIYAIALATFVYVIDFSLSTVSIPYVAGDIGADHQEGTYIITAFQTGSAILIAATSWFGRKFGLVRMMLFSLLCNAIFAGLTGLSSAIETIVLARFFQGFLAGMILPLSFLMLSTYCPVRTRPKAIGIWATALVVAPVFGPLIGGYFCVIERWQWIFFIQIPLSLIPFFLILPLYEENEVQSDVPPLDWVSVACFAFGVTCVQIILDKGQQYDWWTSVILCMITAFALVSIIFVILRCLSVKNPYLNFQLFKKTGYTLAVLVLFISYSMYSGSLVVTALWLETTMNYDGFMAALPLVAISIVPMTAFFWIGRLKISYESMLVICFLIFGAVSCYTAFFNTQVDIRHIAFTRFLAGIGFAFYVVPIVRYYFSQVEEKQTDNAINFFFFFRNFATAFGSSVFTTIWERRLIFHHQALSELITPYSTPTVQFFVRLKEIGQEKSLYILNLMTDQQAMALSFNDVFWFITWTCVVLIIALLLAPKKATS